ncbi:MAG: hypothetical protein ACYTGN_08760 [Planctomycetota bacterium]
MRESGRTRVDLQTTGSAPLTIRVVDPQDQPVAGAELVWTFPAIKPLDSSMVGDREPPGFGSNIANAEGVIRKPFFPEGAVELRIDAEGFKTVRKTVTLAPPAPSGFQLSVISDQVWRSGTEPSRSGGSRSTSGTTDD